MPTTDLESVPPEEESNIDPGIARWIPFVPLSALIILLSIFLIYAEVLR